MRNHPNTHLINDLLRDQLDGIRWCREKRLQLWLQAQDESDEFQNLFEWEEICTRMFRELWAERHTARLDMFGWPYVWAKYREPANTALAN